MSEWNHNCSSCGVQGCSSRIEKLKNECLQDYENATNNNTHYYFRGGYCNIYYCLNKIKKEFNIKD